MDLDELSREDRLDLAIDDLQDEEKLIQLSQSKLENTGLIWVLLKNFMWLYNRYVYQSLKLKS